MAYTLRQFGSILLPEYKEEGQSDNMGTGLALTSWQQLPNGTYFDNYAGVERRPQGIRPRTKEGLLIGSSHEAIETQIDNLRKHIGVRDKLTVQFMSGRLRWQYAVLRQVDIAAELFRNFTVPAQLTFETAAQHWYELIRGVEGWTVGDDSFTLGDGTAGLGQNDFVFTINGNGSARFFSLTHNGNIPATNLIITVTAGTTNLTQVDLQNVTSDAATANDWICQYTSTILAGESLVIDCGAQTVLNDGDNAYADFSATHRGQWMRLEAEAVNSVRVVAYGNSNLDATISFRWFEHYA